MPFLPSGVGAAIAGGVASAGAGALISGLTSPGTSGGGDGTGNGSSLYVPTGLGTADQQWQSLQNSLYNTYNQTGLNQYGQSSLDAGVQAGSVYGPQLQQYANQAGQQYAALGQQLQGASGQDFGAQQGLLNAGQQVYQNSLDPNQAQYNLSLNNLTQQTGATNSMYGLGSSAAGAGVQNQALSNFGINWNTQQLQNQIAGLGAYGQAAGEAGQLGGQGATLGAAGAASTQQAGSVPYNTAVQNAGLAGQLGNAYGSYLNQNVYTPAQTIQGTGQNYMNSAEGVNATAFNAGNQAAGALGSSVAQGVSGLGNAVQNAGGFANLFSGTTGSFGGGNFSGAFNSNPYYSGGGNSYGFTS